MAGIELEDQSERLLKLNAWLELDPHKTAIVTIDMHKGHLDPNVRNVHPKVHPRNGLDIKTICELGWT